jgi:hypothetical protein
MVNLEVDISHTEHFASTTQVFVNCEARVELDIAVEVKKALETFVRLGYKVTKCVGDLR